MVRNISFESSSFEKIIYKTRKKNKTVTPTVFLVTLAGLFIVDFMPGLQIFIKTSSTFLLVSWFTKLRLKHPATWNSLPEFSSLGKYCSHEVFKRIHIPIWALYKILRNMFCPITDNISIECESISLELMLVSSLKSLHKKMKFPLRISLVNVTKSTGKCAFGHIYWRILIGKLHFLCIVL